MSHQCYIIYASFFFAQRPFTPITPYQSTPITILRHPRVLYVSFYAPYLRRARAAIMLKNMPIFLLFSRAIYRYKSPKWARTNIERLALSQLHVLGIGCGKRTPFAQRIAFTFVSQVWQGLRVLPFLRVRIYASSG